MGGENFDRVAAYPERAADKVLVIAAILQCHEFLQQVRNFDRLAGFERDGHRLIGFKAADAVNAGHAGDEDDVAAFHQRTGRGMAHPVDLFIDRGVFFDKRVRPGDIGFRLVVIVIGHEIFHRIMRKERFHLAVKLGREGLVRRQDQCRAIQFLDDMGHRKCLARPGNAEQHLVFFMGPNPFEQFRDGMRLVARRRVIRHDLERNAVIRCRQARAVGEGGVHAPNMAWFGGEFQLVLAVPCLMPPSIDEHPCHPGPVPGSSLSARNRFGASGPRHRAGVTFIVWIKYGAIRSGRMLQRSTGTACTR